MIALAVALQLAVSTPVQGDSAVRAVQAVQAVQADAVFGADKLQHFAMSYAITSFAFAGSRNESVAVATAAAAGIAKELYDHSKGRPLSVLDLLWDAAGIAVGFAIIRQAR
ncbi:MAG: hypothetical protein ACT4O1_08445 [Gemmatimonadota bacterium]